VKSGRKVWSIGWRLVVCGVLMFWILHAIFLREGQLAAERLGQSWDALSRSEQWKAGWQHGPRELWRVLCLIDPVAGFGSLVLMGLTILLGVVRWRMVLCVQGLNLPFGRAAEISLVAHFFNSFLLGSTGGDLLKAFYAARETHHKKTEAVTTVFVDRLIGLLSMLLFACLMMIPNLSLLSDHGLLRTVSIFIVCMMLGCCLVAGLSFWGGVSRTLPLARVWLRKLPKGDLLERSLDSCRRFGSELGFLFRALVLSMILNVICVFQVLLLAWGLRLDVAALPLFVIVPIIICISALPITPSGLGVRENLYVLMLAVPAIHVEATHALSLSLLAYAGSLFWSLVGGIVYVCLKETQHLGEVTRADSPAADT
jgi:glycosyltransferase 2 family protein